MQEQSSSMYLCISTFSTKLKEHLVLKQVLYTIDYKQIVKPRYSKRQTKR